MRAVSSVSESLLERQTSGTNAAKTAGLTTVTGSVNTGSAGSGKSQA